MPVDRYDVAELKVVECNICRAQSVGTVDERVGFCAKHEERTIDQIVETLASVGLGNSTITVQLAKAEEGPFTEQYAALARRGEALAQQIKDDTAELESIKTRMREIGAGTWKAGGRPIVTVGESPRKFDEEQARTVLSLEQQAQVTKNVIDAEKVKALFGEDVYDQCRKDKGGKASVSFPGAK